jgi:CheY-like chemotaxis protein
MITVLVVDDSLLDRKIAGGILEAEGATVSYAENGQDALEQMEHVLPDVVLTDLQMPVMDGLELVRRIRKQYSATPVILVTRQGSEEIAVEALRTGASSYVPKRNLKRDLGQALDMVLSARESQRERDQVRDLLQHTECYYLLGYEFGGPKALISHLQEHLDQLGCCNDTDRLRVGTALAEALANALDHGNLELDSELRQEDLMTYRKVGDERATQEPYRDRKVHVTARVSPGEATFVVRDEGPGFNPSNLPDPTDPDNLTKPGGRGVMLIRTFMDDVTFNDSGNEITMVKRRAEN